MKNFENQPFNLSYTKVYFSRRPAAAVKRKFDSAVDMRRNCKSPRNPERLQMHAKSTTDDVEHVRMGAGQDAEPEVRLHDEDVHPQAIGFSYDFVTIFK